MYRRSAAALLAAASALSGCGGPAPRPVTVVAPMPLPAPCPSATADATPSTPISPFGFAASPLTPFANAVTAMGLAARAGERPSMFPFRPRSPGSLVQYAGGASPDARLAVVGFLMELVVSSAPEPGHASQNLRMMLFLSEHGLKIFGLAVRAGSPADPLPDWLAAVQATGEHMMAVAAREQLGEMLMGQDEKPMFGDLWSFVVDVAPKPEELRDAQALGRRHAQVAGYDVNDIHLVAHDEAGTLHALRLDIEGSGVHRYFGGPPLVRVKPLRHDP